MRDPRLILLLLNLPGWGSVSVRKLLESVESGELSKTELIHEAIKNLSTKEKRIKIPDLSDIEKARTSAEITIEACKKNEITILTPENNGYPRRLADTPQEPIILFTRGDITVLNKEQVVAVIGTRKPTSWVFRSIYRIGLRCAEHGAVVLSGLANGCDTAAHQGCLEISGLAIGVLGNAIDAIYPKESESLAESILSCGGCIVSEYPPGNKMTKFQLVARDRIQAALSDSVIVGQTTLDGGSMHAANFSMEKISRPVGVLSGENCQGEAFAGNTDLVQRGAVPLENNEDLLSVIAKKRSVALDRAILFDLDQTLIDSSKLEEKRHSREWKWVLSNLKLIQPAEGVKDLLDNLRKSGLKIGLVSSSPRNYMEAICQFYNWTFDTIVAYHETNNHKPHPDPLLKAAANLGVDVASCIYIGDDMRDQEAAESAGMKFIQLSVHELNNEIRNNFINILLSQS